MTSVESIWKTVLTYLEESIKTIAIKTWFDDITPISFDGKTLVIHTPLQFKKETIDDKYLGILERILCDLFTDDIHCAVITGDKDHIRKLREEHSPYDEYTFQQFIVGSSNKFAHAAAIAVSKNPAKNYNPLFIYGQSGLGKTHLLYAIAAVISNNHPEFKIVYIKGEDFTNELISCIQEGDVQSFRNKYRMADLLLVDDIQFIAGKVQTQEEFFHTFNALYESKKQIVLTSDRPPKEIMTLEDRLKTRFEWGLLADIQPPDYETRLAIIRAKAENLEFDISLDIADYIAKTITSNIRQLEGTVKKMVALHELMERPIDLSLAEDAIKDVFRENPGLNPTPDLIIKEVAKYYNISAEKLLSNTRSKEMVLPRQVSMYLVRNLTKCTLPEMGRIFSRDHTTVLHSINKIEDFVKSSPDMTNVINTLTSNIRGQ